MVTLLNEPGRDGAGLPAPFSFCHGIRLGTHVLNGDTDDQSLSLGRL